MLQEPAPRPFPFKYPLPERGPRVSPAIGADRCAFTFRKYDVIIRHKAAARISLPFSGRGRRRGSLLFADEREKRARASRRASLGFYGIKIRHADSKRNPRRRDERRRRGSRPGAERTALFRGSRYQVKGSRTPGEPNGMTNAWVDGEGKGERSSSRSVARAWRTERRSVDSFRLFPSPRLRGIEFQVCLTTRD